MGYIFHMKFFALGGISEWVVRKLKLCSVGELVMLHDLGVRCCEYESGYEPLYDSMYDENFIYYDEESFEFEGDWVDDGDQGGDGEGEDLVLDEIPLVYCPSKDDFAEA